jgi:hypothetical protein
MKNNLKHILVCTFGTAFFASFSFAQPSTTINGQDPNQPELNTITTALPFMSITPDSRAGGMGDAGTALSASYASIYWNTSILSFAEKKSEIGVSYTPWLRQLASDINLSYLSGYYKPSDRHAIGGSLRYFSLGTITYTDNTGQVIRPDKPSEFELVGGYAFKLSQKLSIGLNGKFAYSNLTGGAITGNSESKAGIAGATDLSFSYFNDRAKLGKLSGAYTFATTINNIGNKVTYSNNSHRDFIPMNLKVATSYRADLDGYNQFTYTVELQKLLVPTPPTYYNFDVNGDGSSYVPKMIAGKNNDVGIISGMLQSFSDAPGVYAKDEDGEPIQLADGTYEIVKGSRLKEELSEINIATGIEYWYNNVFALRSGVFFESKYKGNRQYMNFGVGFKYNQLGIDMSYLVSLNGKNSPLANTLRFSFRYTLGGASKPSGDE